LVVSFHTSCVKWPAGCNNSTASCIIHIAY
jgi:hypothetical protein